MGSKTKKEKSKNGAFISDSKSVSIADIESIGWIKPSCCISSLLGKAIRLIGCEDMSSSLCCPHPGLREIKYSHQSIV